MGMVHLNGNVLCAIDCETNGDVPGYHDLLKVCFLPIDYKLDPWEAYPPFQMELKPKRPYNYDPEAPKINREMFCHAVTHGIEPNRAADLFEEWFAKFHLGFNKKISPLGHNWPHDLGFITDWLGTKAVEHFIDERFRDSMSLAVSINDIYDFKRERHPFTRVGLKDLCRLMHIEYSNPHDPLADCIATVNVYKRLVLGSF